MKAGSRMLGLGGIMLVLLSFCQMLARILSMLWGLSLKEVGLLKILLERLWVRLFNGLADWGSFLGGVRIRAGS